MRIILLAGIMAAALAATAQNAPVTGSDAPPKAAAHKVDFLAQLNDVTAQLKEKFDAGKTNTADLDDTLKAINALIVQHVKDGNREQVARLYLLDAHIYADAWHNDGRARAIWGQVIRDFPATVAARGAALSLAHAQAALANDPDPSIPEGLQIGQRFPDFTVTDFTGAPLSVAAHRGHVTMIDFWATWCEPCKEELPNVMTTFNQFHAQGFDIIGVSLDADRGALANYLQSHAMPWPEYFDGLAWENKLAAKYDVRSIPMDYLLDTHGIIIGKALRGNSLPEAVYKSLTME